MGTGRTDEFRKDAVRIALTSGLTRQTGGGRSGRRNVDAEQMDHGAPGHGCGVA